MNVVLRPEAQALFGNLKVALGSLEQLLERCNDHWGVVYRFYHQSYKVYRLQELTVEIVEALQGLAPERKLNDWFMQIVSTGTEQLAHGGYAMDTKAPTLKDKIASRLTELEEPFLSIDVFAKICSLEEFAGLRDTDFTMLSIALMELGYLRTARGTTFIQGRETRAWMWEKGPDERLCDRHEQFVPCEVCKVEAAEREARDADSTARLQKIDAGIAQLNLVAAESDVKEDNDAGPQSRGVVVLDRKLENLKMPLQGRNMIVLVAAADEIDDEARVWLLPHRVVIVEDDAPFVDDASSYEYGIVSCGLLSNREPKWLAKVISDVFVHRPKLWHRRHGWRLVLRDDGEHEYEPLVD